jgi:hypothetical protein
MKHRLLVAAIGAFFVLVGIYRLAAHGYLVGMNHLHQLVFSTDAIGAGAAIVVCALTPSSWIERSANLPKPKPPGKKPLHP